MISNGMLSPEFLEMGRKLVDSIESGNEETTNQILGEIVELRESDLFQELGRLTRQLHESLQNVRMDDRIAELAVSEIPDAKDRLNHVLLLTDQAAHRTLNMVEEAMPISQGLKTESSELLGEWKKFTEKKMTADEFRSMTTKISRFLLSTEDKATAITDNLSQVVLAQDFQDLTGQIILKVLSMVQELENGLVTIIKKCAVNGVIVSPEDNAESSKSSLGGPEVPGLESTDAVGGQNDVDQLLSELGF